MVSAPGFCCISDCKRGIWVQMQKLQVARGVHACSSISLTELPSCSWVIKKWGGLANTFFILYSPVQYDSGLDHLLQMRDRVEGLPLEQRVLSPGCSGMISRVKGLDVRLWCVCLLLAFLLS